MDEKLFTVREVAKLLRCSLGFAYELLSSGRLKYYALGKGQGGKRVSESHLRAYLESIEKGGAVHEAPPVPEIRKRQFVFLPPA